MLLLYLMHVIQYLHLISNEIEILNQILMNMVIISNFYCCYSYSLPIYLFLFHKQILILDNR